MPKVLAIVAAALLAASAPAFAKSKPVKVTLDGLCDTLTFTEHGATGTFASRHLARCAVGAARLPQHNAIPGVGVVTARQEGASQKRRIVVGETMTDDLGAQAGYMYVLDYPFVTGGRWLAYTTFDGAAVSEFASGTYTVR